MLNEEIVMFTPATVDYIVLFVCNLELKQMSFVYTLTLHIDCLRRD